VKVEKQHGVGCLIDAPPEVPSMRQYQKTPPSCSKIIVHFRVRENILNNDVEQNKIVVNKFVSGTANIVGNSSSIDTNKT
jgi:hypothetical protein